MRNQIKRELYLIFDTCRLSRHTSPRKRFLGFPALSGCPLNEIASNSSGVATRAGE